jgi:hypothetical protein
MEAVLLDKLLLTGHALAEVSTLEGTQIAFINQN